jgi:AraC-like DNA-binding protein
MLMSDMGRPLQELASIIDRFTESDGLVRTAIPALSLYRWTFPSDLVCGLYEPALTVVAQGAKCAVLAGETYEYDPAHYLVTSIDLPVVSQVTRATPERPFLCLSIGLDARRIGTLMAKTDLPEPPAMPVQRAMSVSRLAAPLLDAVLRLVRLLEAPADIPILAPLIEREILYRLLTGEQGMRLRHIAMAGSQAHQVARVTDWLKANYAQPVRIEALAKMANMSVSSLHHHFKAITAMSPLRYQKQLRLQEARRLMLAEKLDAASAGHQVGYESPSQFSREYSRLYGVPPRQDVAQLRYRALEESHPSLSPGPPPQSAPSSPSDVGTKR